jgi:hypothetical protein
MAGRLDFVDEILDDRSKRNPDFPGLVQAALERRAACHERSTGEPGPTTMTPPLGRSATEESGGRGRASVMASAAMPSVTTPTSSSWRRFGRLFAGGRWLM